MGPRDPLQRPLASTGALAQLSTAPAACDRCHYSQLSYLQCHHWMILRPLFPFLESRTPTCLRTGVRAIPRVSYRKRRYKLRLPREFCTPRWTRIEVSSAGYLCLCCLQVLAGRRAWSSLLLHQPPRTALSGGDQGLCKCFNTK